MSAQRRPVERLLFQTRFLEAASTAREFAQEFLLEKLPPASRFHLHLNQSYDANAGDDVTLFPQDASSELASRLKHITADAVVDALWRDGLVPEWVNVSVVGRTPAATVIEVLACGRFRADEAGLYHAWEGRPPFHVLSPVLPVDHVEGKPFSIYTRAGCWTRSDLQHVLEHADKVWSLALSGPAFDDALLLEALDFPKLELLQLRATSVSGPGLAAVDALPTLRVLDLACGSISCLDLAGFSLPPRITHVSLTRLPAEMRGIERLRGTRRRRMTLSLASADDVKTDAELTLPEVTELSLSFPHVPSWIRDAFGVERMTLRFPKATDARVAEILLTAAATLTSVTLSGTPVTDEIFDALARMPHLKYADLSHTRVTPAALTAFTTTRPHLKYRPPIAED